MTRRLAVTLVALAALVIARPAWAPYHLMVIQEVFVGTPNAPDAQYVQLKTLAMFQVSVQTKTVTAQNADGSSAGTFATFPFDIELGNFDQGVAILVGTPRAHDLFCLPFDQIAAGNLVFPDGRACFATSVDCVAYGNFTGNNGSNGPPAVRPILGKALVRVDNTHNNEHDFALNDPVPTNNSGVIGQIDGIPGDSDGTGDIDVADLDHEVAVLFEAGMRCDIADPDRRGADANVDTRIGAADITATIVIALGATA